MSGLLASSIGDLLFFLSIIMSSGELDKQFDRQFTFDVFQSIVVIMLMNA